MKLARTDQKAKAPTRKHQSHSGLDLYALGNFIIGPHSTEIINTGIAIELPEGTMGLIKPKSKHTRLVGAGVVDQNYRGEIKVRIFNTGKRNLYIEHHEPVAQLVVVPILTLELNRVPYGKLKETDRGDTGGIN